MAYFFGVDGCPSGWLRIGLTTHSNWQMEVYPTFTDLMYHAEDSPLVLVDIPIGLPDREKRHCDRAARQRLTRLRGSSVFPVPSRKAVFAPDYLTACDQNEEDLGVRVSKQAWLITPKMLEVDIWLQQHDPTQQRVRECHPELAFWAMAEEQPMSHNKKSSNGRAERLAVLKSKEPLAQTIFDEGKARFPRQDVALDDILDALALAITAAYGRPLVSLPDTPQLDAVGLRMEITHGEWES